MHRIKKIKAPIGDENLNIALNLLITLTPIKKIKAPIGDENCQHGRFKKSFFVIKKIKAPIGDENRLFGYCFQSLSKQLRK